MFHWDGHIPKIGPISNVRGCNSLIIEIYFIRSKDTEGEGKGEVRWKHVSDKPIGEDRPYIRKRSSDLATISTQNVKNDLLGYKWLFGYGVKVTVLTFHEMPKAGEEIRLL